MERGQAQDGRFLLSLAIFLALIALFILLGSPLFALREIIVDGGSYFTAEDIWQISGLRKNQNILMVDVEQVQLALLAEPRVSDVCVQLILPHRLQVQLEERTPIALLPYRDVFYLVDRQGRLIGAEATVTESLPFLTGVRLDNPAMGTKPVSHELTVGIMVANALDVVIAEGVSEINVTDPTDICLYMRNLVMVKLGDSLEMKEKLMVLKPLLADLARRSVTPKQIDLSIPNQPVVLQ